MLPGLANPLLAGGSTSGGGGGGGGGGGSPVTLQDATIEHIVVDPANASASWTINTGGNVTATGGVNYTWRLAGVSADYEVTLDGGGAWLSLSTTRSISKVRNNIGVSEGTYDVRIRHAVTHVELAAASVTVRAEVD